MHSTANRTIKAALATACAIPVALMLAAGPAQATVQLFPSASPLPGSSFQGGDGNQTPANATTRLDWKNFKNDPDLKTLVDPSNPDREFGGGSSEDTPDRWTFSDPSESTPLKANFRVAWDLFKSDPGKLLQLSFRRAANGGNAFLAFELNQKPKLWTNAAGTKIPCRTTGDLLITYNVANNDATQIYLTLQEWTSSTSDPASGCARTGALTELPDAALQDGVNVQGAVNSALSNAISPELPSPPAGLPNNESGAIPSEMESGLSCGSAQNWICGGLFGEAAIDLPSVFTQYQENPCFSFGSIWAHGRSSISQSSALQDYVEPVPIAVRSCTASGFKFNDRNANGKWDSGEPPVEGWKVWLDKNKDGKVDSPGEIATTDSTGEYVFSDLSTGTYSLKELPAADQAGDLQMLDTCSYPADCAAGYSVKIDSANLTSTGNTFGNYARPRLELVKSLKPSDDPGLFNLSATQTSGGSGSISSTDSGDGQGTGKKTVTPGAWKLAETAGTGTSMDDYSSSVACRDRESASSFPSSDGSVTLAPGDDVICTFTNTRNTGEIKLTKQLLPSTDTGLFNLLIGGKEYATDVGDGGTTGFQNLNTGSWSIGEAAGTSTSLDDYRTNYACEDSEGPVKIVEGDEVNLADGQKISCVATNTRKTGTITVDKSLSPSTDPGLFDLLIGGNEYATDIGDNGTTGKQTLNTGSYSIGETAGTGTTLDDYATKLACQDEEGTVTVEESKVTLTDGQNITCTFTNTRNTGQVKLVKKLSPADDAGRFNLQLDGNTKAAGVGDGGASETLTVNTGGHTISEVAAEGTSLSDYTSSASCEAGGQVIASGEVTTLELSVTSGQAVTCTFKNTRNSSPPPPPTPPVAADGTIVIAKNVTSGPAGVFGFTGSLGDFTLAGGSSTSFSLPAGTYSVTEPATVGFVMESLACSDAGDANGSSSISGTTATISLQAGETVACTWTNGPSGAVVNPAIAGSARVSGSQGCVRNRYAYVRVRGGNIARVSFFASGKRISTLTERNSRGRYYELRYPVSRIKPGASKRITATVLFVSGAEPQATTLRWRVVRCAARVKPGFTG